MGSRYDGERVYGVWLPPEEPVIVAGEGGPG